MRALLSSLAGFVNACRPTVGQASRPWRRSGACLALLVVLAPAAVAAPASAPAAAPAPDLYALIDARLELMRQVAAWKWRHHQPIEDREREAVVLEQAVADAGGHGLTASSSRAFFRAQIEAAKQIQRHWFGVWQAGGEPVAAEDLNTVIRPELLRLGREIVAAAADPRPISEPAFTAALTVEGLDDASRAALLEALRGLERFGDRLEQILATRVLRIGTTGDYAPFSYREGDEPPVGIDIDLGRDLAATLGVEAAFVQTSWPTLLDDLDARRYDIAMSGVSRTADRQARGFMTRAYYVGGKTAIARCEHAGDYASLAAIDRPGVRVIVNPGGTNERFVDSHVHSAAKIRHDDNRTIFAELLDGRADVMITDHIEAELQASRHPELCPTMPGLLSHQEKAFLLPRDAPWNAFVDTWVALALADGSVESAFHRHGAQPRTAGR